MLSHSDVIEAFGGYRPLAEAIHIEFERAVHWGRRGIPSRYWPAVETAARARGIEVTAVMLMRLRPPPPSRKVA